MSSGLLGFHVGKHVHTHTHLLNNLIFFHLIVMSVGVCLHVHLCQSTVFIVVLMEDRRVSDHLGLE